MKLPSIMAAMFTMTLATTAAEPAQTLVDLEHAFAKAVAEQGMGPAFAKFLALDGYIFRPQPTLGKAWHSTNSTPGRLRWEPELAVLSAAGDLGYTTGPWKYFADDRSSEVVASGHYFSVWQKQADDSWGVTADIGIPHEPQSLTGIQPVLRVMPAITRDALEKGSLRKEMLEADGQVEFDRATNMRLATSSRGYRVGQLPFIGQELVVTAWQQHGRVASPGIECSFVSSCGTLGCTLGIEKLVFPPESGKAAVGASYLRVWERGGSEDWKLAAEVALPWPAKTP